MASIKKRNNSYLITVSLGYDINNKQLRKSITYKPEPGLSPKREAKAVQAAACLFEEKCKNGLAAKKNVKFAAFSAEWIKHKQNTLRPKTYDRYVEMLPRINAAIGHLHLDKIKPQQLLSFYSNLAEQGVRLDTKYRCKLDIVQYIKKHNLNNALLAQQSEVSSASISALRNGHHCNRNTAEKIAKCINMPFDEVFEAIDSTKTLSSKTILHHHRLISSILSTAVEWEIIPVNPCTRTKPPRVERNQPKYLDEVQAATLLKLLENERYDFKIMIRLLLFTGMRRSELLGLKWFDVDFKNKTLNICRSLKYRPKQGLFEDETKNASSNRVIRLSNTTITDLEEYRIWQSKQRLEYGTFRKDTDYIFTRENGTPFHPDTLTGWFSLFIDAHSTQLPKISIHSLRHTNATLQIAGGVPITSVAKRLGHADTITTGRIYAHPINSADEAAADILENILTPRKKRPALLA